MSKINDIASDAAFALIDRLTADLKATASAADWPDYIVNSLAVQWDGNSLFVAYPPSLAKEIEDLEYGNFSDKPNSVIRAFLYRCSTAVKEVLMNRTLPQLMDAERLFA